MSTSTSMGDVWLATHMPLTGRFSGLLYVMTEDRALDKTAKHIMETL